MELPSDYDPSKTKSHIQSAIAGGGDLDPGLIGTSPTFWG